ncbi:LPD7 domain-containing protein, partial [Pseudomonas sp.]|uniref:LPD7 domain-containing protein n=1 Tax=Pseudomonas sp. TaxID=306 RepID=UPI0025E82463
QKDPDRSVIERKAAMSIARMQRVTQDMALREATAEERQLLKNRYRQPYQTHYRAFLADLAGQGDGMALSELRRQRDAAPVPRGSSISQGRERGPGKKDDADKEEASYLERSLAYSIDHAGDVTYYADQTRRRVLLVDSGQRVTFVDIKDRQVVEAGLRLALQKFGPSLKIEGDDQFRQQLIDAAFRTGLQVEFDSPAMNSELARRRAEQNELQARGRAFIDSEREKEARTQVQSKRAV